MATTLRAAIMLTVLLGGPCAWMYYGPLPAGPQRVVDRFVAAAKEALGGTEEAVDSPRTSTATATGSRIAAPVSEAAPPMAPGPRGAAVSSASFEQRIAPLLAELKQLGAVAYDLEPWGEGGRLFRFRCEMPLVAGGQATEEFAAIAADPQKSIEQVAAQVASRRDVRSSTLP